MFYSFPLHLSFHSLPLPLISPSPFFTLLLSFLPCSLLLRSLFALSIPTAGPLSLLFSLLPLRSSRVNCSLNPVRVRLQLHMSILPPPPPPPALLSLDVAASPLQGGKKGGELVESGPCLPAWDTAGEKRAVSPSLSFFLCTSGAWGDWAELCCVVLSLAQRGCRISAWLRWSSFKI